MLKLIWVTIADPVTGESAKFGTEIKEGGKTWTALCQILFFEGLFGFISASSVGDDKTSLQRITFHQKTHPDYICGEDLIRTTDIITYLAHKNGTHRLEKASFYMLVMGLKFDDEEMFAMSYDFSDPTIREHFQELSAYLPGFAGNYVGKLIKARIGGKKKKLHAKTKLSAVLSDELGAWLWDQCDEESRLGILAMVEYGVKGRAARTKATAARNLEILQKERSCDKYSEAFYKIVGADPRCAKLKAFLKCYGILPSDRNVDAIYRWGFTDLQEDHECLLAQQKHAYNESSKKVDSARAAAKPVAQLGLAMIKAMCAK